MRQNAVEYASPGAIVIASGPDVITKIAPRLRAAPGIGFLDRTAIDHEWVGGSVSIHLIATQEASDIADCHVSEPVNKRIAGFINEFVDPAGLKALGHEDIDVRRHDRTFSTLVVETSAAFCACKHPSVRGDHFRLGVRIASPNQTRLGRVQRVGRDRACRHPGRKREGGDARSIRYEFGAGSAGDRLAIVSRNRNIEQQAMVARQDVALPTDPRDNVTPAHKVTVTHLRERFGIIGPGSIVEELEAALVAAIDQLNEQPSAGIFHVNRFEKLHVGLECYATGCIDGRLVEVDNKGVLRGFRVYA